MIRDFDEAMAQWSQHCYEEEIKRLKEENERLTALIELLTALGLSQFPYYPQTGTGIDESCLNAHAKEEKGEPTNG